MWTHLPVTPAPLARLHCPFTQPLRRCNLASLRPWLPTNFPEFNRLRLQRFRLRETFGWLRGVEKGWLNSARYAAVEPKATFLFFLLLLFGRIKKKKEEAVCLQLRIALYTLLYSDMNSVGERRSAR
jgi:hypothetical protein